MEKVASCDPCFASRRLHYDSCDPFVRLEIELVESASGLRLYLNSFSLPLNSPEVVFRVDATCKSFSGVLLEGGQRLLLPDELRDWIIAALANDSNVDICVGPYRALILPNRFLELYAP